MPEAPEPTVPEGGGESSAPGTPSVPQTEGEPTLPVPPGEDEETPTPEDDDSDPEDLPDGESFPRTVVEKERDRYAKERIKRRDLEKQLEEYGGLDVVQAAVGLRNHLLTEDGAAEVFFHLGRSMGLSMDTMKGMFEGDEGGEGGEPPDPDRPLTAAEFKAWQEEQVKSQEQKTLQQQQAGAKKAIDATLRELGLDSSKKEDQQVIQSVLGYGSAHLGDDLDPEKVAAAVKQGFEEFKSVVAASQKRYLEGKKQQAENTPSVLSGKAPGGPEPEAEPQSVAEAKRRVRDQIKAGHFG